MSDVDPAPAPAPAPAPDPAPTPVAPVSLARTATVLLLATAVVLALVLVAKAAPPDADERAEAGSRVPLEAAPYGRSATVLLPGKEVDVTVGDPVDRLDRGLLDYDYDDPRSRLEAPLAAPDGGTLVPLSWQVVNTGGFGAEDDPHQVDVALVVDDERIELDTVGFTGSLGAAYDPTSVALALDQEVEVDDLTVEVTYDGLTQVLDVATGDVDAGAAELLYDPLPSLSTGCAEVPDDCDLRAADPRSPLRPSRAGFIAGDVVFYPYSRADGWAEEGTVWASVYIQMLSSSGIVDAGGDYWTPAGQDTPTVTLDGAASVSSELNASDYDSVGYVVFSVERADVGDLAVLQIDQTIDLPPSAPADSLPVRARLPLTAS